MNTTKDDKQTEVRTVCKLDKKESLIVIMENQVKIDSNNEKYCDQKCPSRYVNTYSNGIDIRCTLFTEEEDVNNIRTTKLFSKGYDSIRHDLCMAIFENEKRTIINQPPIKEETNE